MFCDALAGSYQRAVSTPVGCYGMFAQIVERSVDFPIHLIANSGRDIYFAGPTKPLKSSRNVNALAINVVALHDDVAKVNTNTQVDPTIVGYFAIPPCYGVLHVDGMPYRIKGARKFNQHTVTHCFDDATAIFHDFRFEQFSATAVVLTFLPRPRSLAASIRRCRRQLSPQAFSVPDIRSSRQFALYDLGSHYSRDLLSAKWGPGAAHVRFGSKADIATNSSDVCFTTVGGKVLKAYEGD